MTKRTLALAALVVCLGSADAEAADGKNGVGGEEPVAEQERVGARARNWFFGLAGGFQSANGGASPGPLDFDHPRFGFEPGRFEARPGSSGGSLFETSVGYVVQDGVAVAVTLHKATASADVQVAAELPHPIWFDRPRSVSGVASVGSAELAVHVSLMWRIRGSGKLEFALFAGPSWFHLEQEFALPGGLRVDSEYPYDTATFTKVEPRTYSTAATGYHVGVEAVRWFRTRTGLRGVVRYADAPVEFNIEDDTRRDAQAGRLHASVGLLVRF